MKKWFGIGLLAAFGVSGQGAFGAETNPIYDMKVPAKKRVTSGEKNTAKNDMDWLFRNVCPSIMKKKATPETVTESEYQELSGRLLESRNLDPEALEKLKAEDYFKKNLERAGIKNADDYLRQCTQIAHEYATGKNASKLDLSDPCVGERYPVWINLNLIDKYYKEWKEWKSSGKGRQPLVFRSRECLEWARNAMNINELVAYDESLDLKVLAGNPDETTLRKLLNPSGPAKMCDANDEFKAAFNEINPKSKNSEFWKHENMVTEMEKDAGVEYAGIRVWYTGGKSALKDKRNKILYRLTKDAKVMGRDYKAGDMMEDHSDKF